jgi:hypothetical protein
MKNARSALTILLASALIGAALTFPQTARAHCDTMDGPVVVAAKAALEQKDVTPVLKWVKADAESEIKSAFAKTLAVRSKTPEARELADQFFFETLVRVHRAGEGAPFTGLKPAGTPLEPAIEEADRALESGSADKLVKLVTDHAAAGIRRRLAEAHEKKAHSEQNIKAGRDFVAAYVEYVHYVEGLHQTTQAISAHHGDAPEAASEAAHHPPTQHQH